MTGPTHRRLFLALALGLVLVGISLRTIDLGRPALCCDEFFDVYSARSWLAGEGFQVPGRENERALMMARATGASFAAFGESEWSARLPAVVLGILTLPLIALAGRVLFGPVAAIVALGLLAISPHGIDVSRFARLYSPLTILLLGGVTAIYIGLEGRRREGPVLRLSRILWLAGGGLFDPCRHPLPPGGSRGRSRDSTLRRRPRRYTPGRAGTGAPRCSTSRCLPA